jgi:glycosyltransferase involved in cell wall biosynthesis
MKISIIIPVYNVQVYLNQCINSVVSQSYDDLEIILVDDGSTDNSPRICDDFVLKDDRIKVIHKQNGGVSSARNAGLNMASGDFIQFVDSDDYIEHNMCEVLINTLSKNKADLAMCGFFLINNEIVRKCFFRKGVFKRLSDLKNDFSSLYINCFFNSPFNKLYRKNLIASYFDEQLSLGEDLIFNLNYMKNCTSIAITDKCLYNYVTGNPNSLTSKYRGNMFDIIMLIFQSINEFCDDKVGTDVDKTGIYYVLISNLIGAIQLLVYNGEQTNKEKCGIIKKWISNENIRTACKYQFTFDFKQKLSFIFIKNKNAYLLYLFYKIKKCIYKLIILGKKMMGISYNFN